MPSLSITPEQVEKWLTEGYEKALTGFLKEKSCKEVAARYLEKYKEPEKAAKEFIRWQVTKCTASGFVTSFGGLPAMAVGLPVNLASVIYVQLRMIAVIAALAGLDPSDDEVRTLAYVCLLGSSASKVFKEAGVKVANKLTLNAVKKIPGKALTKINQMVSFRLVTKLGTKGVINLGKMVPVAGGLVGGGIDYAGTKLIARNAVRTFIRGDLS